MKHFFFSLILISFSSVAVAQSTPALFAPLKADTPLTTTTRGTTKNQRPSTDARAMMPPQAAARHQARLESKSVGRYWFGQAGSLEATLAVSGERKMYLPHLEQTVAFRETYREQVGKVMTIHGELVATEADDASTVIGRFGLSESLAGVSGYVNTSGMNYNVYPAGSEASVLYEMSAPSKSWCHTATANSLSAQSTTTPTTSAAEAITADSSEVSVVDLVVAFTPLAVSEVDPEVEAAMIVTQMNNALSNSRVDNLRYRLAAAVELELSSIDEGGFIRDGALFTLQTSEEVQMLYETYNADQVQVVAGLGGGNPFGTSELNDPPQTRNLTLTTAQSIPFFVPSHELGHNHGCKHLDDDRVGGLGELNVYARGFEVDTAIYGGTIMVAGINTDLNAPQAAPYFSSPDIIINGSPIGVVDEYDNARQLHETAALVASLNEFVGGPEPTVSNGVGRTEAEAMFLVNYETRARSSASEQTLVQAVSRSQETSASYIFTGLIGFYDVTVRYLDEANGNSSFTLFNDGFFDGPVQWVADEVTEAPDQWRTETVRDVLLFSNTRIEVRATPDGEEFARIDYVEVRSSNDTAPSDNGLVVRARGTTGEETMELRLDDEPVTSWTVTTDWADYAYQGDVSGNVKVAFTNDGRTADEADKNLRVDEITVAGSVLQAEDQATNTGAWEGTCGAGSNTERLDCNGFIDFGSAAMASRSAVARPKGQVSNQLSASELVVYPNPASDGRVTVEVQAGTSLPERLWMINSQGKTVLSQTTDGLSTVDLDVHTLPSGIYLLRTSAQQTSWANRIVVP